MSKGFLQDRTLEIFLACIAAVLLFSALFPRQAKPRDISADASVTCKGTPINVPLAYTGSPLDPWSCQPQCDDKQQHYLVYTNGVATQCETLPGCFDTGEDSGVTCKIPGSALPVTPNVTPASQSSVSSQS